MLSVLQIEVLKLVAQQAVKCEETSKVPAELTVAQWAIESGWGAHQPGNNCFGIKAYPGCWGVQNLLTVEVIAGHKETVWQKFASFPSLAACFAKHAELLREGMAYQPAWETYLRSGNLTALVRQLAPIYATDPGYAQNLLTLISLAAVKSAISNARHAALVPAER